MGCGNQCTFREEWKNMVGHLSAVKEAGYL